MAKLSRRAALGVLATGSGLLGAAYVLRRSIIDMPSGHANGPGMGGVSGTDMSRYMNMFMRHGELRRTVEDIPGGIRTTTESNSADLVAELQAHVSSMYSHLGEGEEVTCMSQSLPTLFRRAPEYQRHVTFTAKGIVAEETATDPALTNAIRAHAREVTGFVVEGVPAMMRNMMGNGMMRGARS
ncbi:hypothetical protein EUA02_30345 [Mycobacterium paragordonae]|uniref:hypothetical protein n=1 Tax=Mycobacterium paragordonae TaxID=1389713 RepID=UPI001060D14C|nr:hypothetical protein [Mycobacterium paragordonae]TDK85076.1 hypothetical protein EUA02_30345 [Mycobacterium paragordonae]TDK96813.1 hypothetical protein EUA05_32015 [Mycobacterium paragordonae]